MARASEASGGIGSRMPSRRADHPGDLLLGGAAESGRRRLDLLGAVFVDGDRRGAPQVTNRGAAGLAELEGGRGFFARKTFLHGGFRGPMEKDQVGEFAMDPEEAVGEDASPSSRMTPHATGDTAFPRDVDDPVPGPQRPRVDPKIRRKSNPPLRLRGLPLRLRRLGEGAPFVARRAVNLHGCALPHFAPLLRRLRRTLR